MIQYHNCSGPLLNLLTRDFAEVKINETFTTTLAFSQCPPSAPTGLALSSKNCVIYFGNKTRTFQYGPDAQLKWDISQDVATLYCPNPQRAHEITYLYTLSRIGKALDRRGIHRIHGAAFESAKYTFIILASMGSGKTSSLLSTLNRYPELRYFSDDSPLIDQELRVHPFALRFGLKTENVPLYKSLKIIDWTQAYILERQQYGSKTLVPTTALSASIASPSQKPIVFLKLRRCASPSQRLKKLSRMRLLKMLFEDLVIGVGLPIMREYFIEFTVRDFFILARIALSRLWLTHKLVAKCPYYEVEVGDTIETAFVPNSVFEIHNS